MYWEPQLVAKYGADKLLADWRRDGNRWFNGADYDHEPIRSVRLAISRSFKDGECIGERWLVKESSHG
jgi:hypothetical protein